MNRDNAHVNWWQSLNAVDRFSIMKKYGVKQVTDKLIRKMFENHVPDNMKAAYQ